MNTEGINWIVASEENEHVLRWKLFKREIETACTDSGYGNIDHNDSYEDLSMDQIHCIL